jgi:Immunity protein 8
VAVRARIVGWHHPNVASIPHPPARSEEIPQGVLPERDRPQSFTLEVTDADEPTGEDYFMFDVHTPDTIDYHLDLSGALFGRGMVVVVDEYNPEQVVETLRPLVESVEAETWEELAFRVGSLAPWEFEGWKWYPEEERLRQDPGVEAEVRGVRLIRTSTGSSFSLPVEVRFGAAGLDDEVAVPMTLQSPTWLRNNLASGAVMPGSGNLFARRPDPAAIEAALIDSVPARAPSWELLTMALTPLRPLNT